MARSHAKVLVQIWRDEDWISQTIAAQWLFWLILSQPKLTLVGSLEVTEARWTNFGADASREVIDGALHELRASGKVIIDDETGELLVRRFTAHDLDAGRLNVNLAKGLWGQWGGIASRSLRTEAVLLMPEEIWEKIEPHAPHDAREIRRWGRLEPDVGTERSDGRFDPPPSSHHPPVATRPPVDGGGDPQAVKNPGGLVDRTEQLGARFSKPDLQIVSVPQGESA